MSDKRFENLIKMIQSATDRETIGIKDVMMELGVTYPEADRVKDDLCLIGVSVAPLSKQINPEAAALLLILIDVTAARSAEEQMEADCRAVCEACEEYSTTDPAPTPFPPVYRVDGDEEIWWHYGIDENGEYYPSCRQCNGYRIREAFRAANEKGEEVDS